MRRNFRNISLMVVLSLMLVAPVLGNPNGPLGTPVVATLSSKLAARATVAALHRRKSWCRCRASLAYNVSETYEFTISLQHASNDGGGFLFWDGGIGTLTAGEGSQSVPDEPGALSQSEPGNDWVVQWTAPSEDAGPANFQLVGNAVNGDGAPNEDDKWNILTFTVSAPGATEIATDEDISLRTISVGDYDSLFVAEEDPEAVEAERQEGIAHDFFANGNLYYWTTLSMIIIAAVIKVNSTSASSVEVQPIWTRASPSHKAFAEVHWPPPLRCCLLTSSTAANHGATALWLVC